eukprot:CAMPEP_0205811800 /NCGR_PEP_ID=MMETSP0205-20121125/16080_1 /ASSEMBLY_ACC=CAM_ASM_000278 /TAXON_ID=36767 /ORGANISM="Euplotes focardii, Strain TN1" /LENGTH=409 /DNA_ID=CAMNT_0053091493 /DNA_START=125 /DNA_END=1351 /DNA_ORIENTATION=+
MAGIKNFADDFKADLTFQVKSGRTNAPYGFGIWYLNAMKAVSDRKGNLFGIKGDYSGLGIFVYKELSGEWVIHGYFNRGMDEYRITSDKINEDNACTINGDVENAIRTIRLDKKNDRVSVMIKAQNTEEYGHCFSIMNEGLKHKGYFGFTADNFDEQHVNDIDLYSFQVFDSNPKEDTSKSIRGDAEYNPNVNKAQDLLHKYHAKNRKEIFKNRPERQDQKSEDTNQNEPKDNVVTIFTISKDEQNTELMSKMKDLEYMYKESVNIFQKQVAGLDANTAQIIEFNKQKATNMSKSFDNVERKVQDVYTAKLGENKPQEPAKNERIDGLRDMVINLDQKIAQIEKNIQDLLATGENVAAGLEQDHDNRIKVAKDHIEKVFDPSVGSLVDNGGSFPISFTMIFFIFIVIMA